MLAALRFLAVAVGLGVGTLTATVVSLLVWLVLVAAGVDGAPSMGLVAGVLVGLAAGGYASGRLASVSHRFHGAVTGLAMAALVLFVARRGGSPAPTLQVLWLATLAIVLGGAGGAWAGRSRLSPQPGGAGTVPPASSPGDRGSDAEESPDSTGQGAG